MFEEKKLPLENRLEINDNKNFGWKVKQEVEEGKGKNIKKYVILERNKNLSNYITLHNLEEKYYEAKNNIKEVKPINEMLAFLLFLLLIIPGLIYVSKKKKEKALIEENNAKMKKEMARLIQEGEQYKR